MEDDKVKEKTNYFKEIVIPVFLVGILLLLFKPLYMEAVTGKINYLYLWLLIGVPFGIPQMFVWLIPKNYDIGGAMGIIVLNLIVGGLIGGFVAVWKLLKAIVYIFKFLIEAIKK